MVTPLLAAAAALLTMTSAGIGYAWSGSARARGPLVTAAVTGAVGVAGEDPPQALLAITVTNPGPGEVGVVGYADLTSSGAVGGFEPPDALVNAGETVELSVGIMLHCDRPRPLMLPDLALELPSGARRTVTAMGAPAVLTDLCSRGPPQTRPLQVTSARVDGPRLLVEVASPSGRRTRIDQVRAGGVVLGVRLPVEVDRTRHTLALQAPATCPTPWQVSGVPTRLLLEVDTGGPAVMSLPLGEPLVRWVLATACGATS